MEGNPRQEVRSSVDSPNLLDRSVDVSEGEEASCSHENIDRPAYSPAVSDADENMVRPAYSLALSDSTDVLGSSGRIWGHLEQSTQVAALPGCN